MQCRRNLYKNLTSGDPHTMDHCQCSPPCSEIIYDPSYSLSTLPIKTNTAFDSIISDLWKRMNPQTIAKKAINIVLEKKKDVFIKSYISRLNVHLVDMNTIKTTEEPDYDGYRLISDIGGQLGLWIGVSVVTLFEGLQLLVSVFQNLRKKDNNTGSD